MITARNLTNVFGTHVVVDRVSFELEHPSIVGLLGTNGAGKSTLLKMLAGVLSPYEGNAYIGGYHVLGESSFAKRIFGYLPEFAPLYQEMRVFEYLSFMAALKEFGECTNSAVIETVERCLLGDVVSQRISCLSKGYRQRVALAQALLGNPPVLILDEPTAGLDPLQIGHVHELFKSLGESTTILFSTHILKEVEEICERVLILQKGKLLLDTPLTQKTGIYLMVKAAEKIPAEIFYIGGVDSVETTAKNSFVIYCQTPGLVINQIGALCLEHRWPILQLYSRKRELENIYLQLIENR